MNGLELSERFYWDILAPLIAETFPFLSRRHTAGLIGYGSDVLGFDDELSRDHEWGPRGQIWLRPQDYTCYAARLDRMFDEQIPVEYLDFRARYTLNDGIQCLVPAPPGQRGRHHIAITSLPRYLRIQLGIRKLPPGDLDWLCLPEQKLLEFTRGKIFTDPLGEITRLRQALAYFPDPVWRMKMLYAWESADDLLDVIPLNFLRGDELMGRLNLSRLVERIMRIIFLLNRRYCPGSPKWVERELNSLPCLASEIGPHLESCLKLDDLQLAVPALAGNLPEPDRGAQPNGDYPSGCAPSAALWARAGGLRFTRYHWCAAREPDARNAGVRNSRRAGPMVDQPGYPHLVGTVCKMKDLYRKKSRMKRDGVGDRII